MKSINHPTRKDVRRRRLIARIDDELAERILPRRGRPEGPMFTADQWRERLLARRAEAAGAVAS